MNTSIQFLLNDELIEIDNIAPETTVLEFLREKLGRKGTKEGCASGDCGACTAVLGSIDSTGGMRYETLNSCITLIPALHGKQLLTVEDLAHDGVLHPVQQAMVDEHGSQCGFCTPGFVMSLFSLYKSSEKHPDRSAIEDALAGNLCRCTGYRSIIDAGMAMNSSAEDQFEQSAAETAKTLHGIDSAETRVNADGKPALLLPQTVDELASALQQYPDARLLAGGTDLSLEITQQLKSMPALIYTGAVAELQTLELREREILIGGACSYSRAEPLLADHYPDFHALLHRLGSRQIRNQGTFGGNIANASPIADTPPVLMALDARLVLQCGDQQRELALESFYHAYKVTDLQAGEFIHSIRLPLPRAGQSLKVYKISKRIDDDISAVLVAISATLDEDVIQEIRIAMGGMAAVPKRAEAAEQVLQGKSLDQQTIESAMQALEQDFTPMTDIRASAAYRMQVAKNCLLRWLNDVGPAPAPASVVKYWQPVTVSSGEGRSHA